MLVSVCIPLEIERALEIHGGRKILVPCTLELLHLMVRCLRIREARLFWYFHIHIFLCTVSQRV